jgi:hypothetical protein
VSSARAALGVVLGPAATAGEGTVTAGAAGAEVAVLAERPPRRCSGFLGGQHALGPFRVTVVELIFEIIIMIIRCFEPLNLNLRLLFVVCIATDSDRDRRTDG